MENVKNEKNQNLELKVQLVHGEFTPLQASDVISSLIEQKIKSHTLENIQNWEKNHKYDNEPIKNRILELENAMKQTKGFMLGFQDTGKKIKIDGVIKMSVID